ncbi:MAG: ABC transporter ATP-binding protein [Clostridia bacterium]|nr:ABC transporter ATP-binding protein [Clostridia bacterium]
MREYYPLLAVGAIVGTLTIFFAFLYIFALKRKKMLSADRRMSDREIIKRIMRYARPHIPAFVAAGAAMLFSIVYDVVSPLLIGRVEETVKDKFELPSLFWTLGAYAGILIVSLVCTYVQALILAKTGQKILSKIREDVFSHVESLSHAQLNATPVGKFVTRTTNDPEAISYMFTNVLVTLAKNIMVIFGVLGAMLLLNYALTLMVLCFVPFVVFFTVVFRKFSRDAHRRVNDANTSVNTFLSENLSGIGITQIFNMEGRKMREFGEKCAALKKSRRYMVLVFALFRPMVYLLYICSVLFLLYLGARGKINDVTLLGQKMTSGVIVSFYIYIKNFYTPIQNLAEQFDALQRSFTSAEKIFGVLDIEPDVVDEPDAVDVDVIRGEIEFRDVWFSYKENEWVLKGVSFRIEAGQSVAFVGVTGSGKSTILSLICRNYDIDRGQILIDGVDIKKYKISSLRSHFGQMLQDVFLFSGDIKSNIVLRDDTITDEEVLDACRYVNADRFISKLPGGIYEPVRERGNNFSAGQRQLLSFARTIVHKPSVIILDEATANIDTETEQLIEDSLSRIRTIGTMIVVAHRLSTIQHSDNIIVIEDGVIVEEGNHRELLEKRGRYYDLYMLQFEKENMK